ncbi:MAG: aldehyde dehydrogenase family protein, partial [Rhodoferax sp.]
VQNGIYDTFMEKVAQFAQGMQPGDPLDPSTTMGAIVDEAQMRNVLGYIESGLIEGATLRTGGGQTRLATGGFYVEPTIFDCPRQTMRIVNEEIFGPVLTAQRFDTEDEAVALANDSIYGLGAGLWTAQLGRAHRVARRLRAGLVWVNCYFDGDISVPFGGVKQSGFGRDKSLHALDKYCDLKTTWINLL